MGRPKSIDGPKRAQPHQWSVAWGEDLDAEIERINVQNVKKGMDDSKGGTAKYLVRQGLRYLEAAKVDPAIAERVEAIYAETLARVADAKRIEGEAPQSRKSTPSNVSTEKKRSAK